MIVREPYDTRLIRTYSDRNCYIVQNETGAEYCEAIDVAHSKYTYTETDKPIETVSVEVSNNE